MSAIIASRNLNAQSDMAVAYPNPANEFVEVATAKSGLTSAVSLSEAQTSLVASTPTRVTIYNAQSKAIHVPTQA